jgi:hypothetical protein
MLCFRIAGAANLMPNALLSRDLLFFLEVRDDLKKIVSLRIAFRGHWRALGGSYSIRPEDTAGVKSRVG